MLNELRFLECEALRLRYREFANKHQGEAVVPWLDFKAAVDEAALPVDRRVRPIYASLTLGFISQGIQFPVLPQLARSLGLGTADLGLVTACTSCARLLANVPATWMAEKVGRRPMLMSGPSMAAVGMLGLANASSFEHLVVSNICVGTGLATTMAGASLYLSDVSTPRNRAQSTAPLLQSALLGFAIGPAIGGGLAQYMGLHLPFVACAGGLFASSIASAALLPETREEGAFPVTLVLFAVEHMHMSSATVGGMLTANVTLMVLATAPATKLSDRLTSRKALMVPAMTANAIFSALQPCSHEAWQFAGLLVGSGLMQAVSMPSISPLILDCTTPDERARALAGRQMVQDLGGLLGASSMGVVAMHHGIPAAMETVAVLQGLAVLWFAARVPGGKMTPPTTSQQPVN